MILFGVKFQGGQHSHNMGPMTKQEPSVAPHFCNVPYLVGFMHGKARGLKTNVGQVLTLASLWLVRTAGSNYDELN
jgi:hypothetical protein